MEECSQPCLPMELPPLAPRTLYTIGYAGRDQDGLVQALRDAGVPVVVDVRWKPSSRNPDFQQRPLSGRLVREGIDYIHLNALGNVNFRGDGPVQCEDLEGGLDDLGVLLSSSDVAIMCMCRRVKGCHRAVIVEALSEKLPHVAVRHL